MDYLRLCLWYSAGVQAQPGDLKHVNKLSAHITKHYNASETNELQKYLTFIKKILLAKRGTVELSCLYDLLNAETDVLAQQCFDLLESFDLALKDVSEGTRTVVAQIVGILWARGCSDAEFEEHVSGK